MSPERKSLAELAGEPQWDALHEQRVYRRVRAEIEEKRRRKRRRPLVLTVALAPAAVGALALLLAALWPDGRSTSRQAPATAVAKKTATLPAAQPAAQPPSLLLADGSRAQLEAGAIVNITRQDSEAVLLQQRRGKVRYEVTKRKFRRFEVTAGGVRVRVVGTIFTVTATENAVHVAVQRGKVIVEQGGQEYPLLADAQLRLPRKEPADHRIKDQRRKVRRPSRRKEIEVGTVLARVDRARRAGDLDRSATMLRTLLRNPKTGSRTPVVLFTLGKVERDRGRFRAAAHVFASCRKRSPRGPLAEDALAEEALARARGGQKRRGASLARRYLAGYPRGVHRQRLKTLADQSR